MGERSSGGVSYRCSGDCDLPGPEVNNHPDNWATESNAQGRDHRKETGAQHGWAAFCDLQSVFSWKGLVNWMEHRWERRFVTSWTNT